MIDRYTDTKECVKRLLGVYHKYNRLVIACDFDETLLSHERDCICVKPNELLKKCKEKGFFIILFTASDKKRHDAMVKYMTENGYAPDSINANPPILDLPFGNHGKPYFNILLDDRAGLGQSIEILEKTLIEIQLWHLMMPSQL